MNLFPIQSQWLPVTSGEVKLQLSEDQEALRLDYDFAKQGGFAVIRRRVDMRLPEHFCVRLQMRGKGLPNRLEIKLVDREDTHNANVWWYVKPALQWPAHSTELCIRGDEFQFAWGPAGGGLPTQIAALEIALVAEAGGSGVCWLEALVIDDHSKLYQSQQRVFEVGTGERLLVEGEHWPVPNGAAWIQQEWQVPFSFAALHIIWQQGAEPSSFDVYAIETSGVQRLLLAAEHTNACDSFIYLGPVQAQAVRIKNIKGAGDVSLQNLRVVSLARARSRTEWLYDVALSSSPGYLPRYFSRQQNYWTVVGSPTGCRQALLSEDGVLEVHSPGFSLEPQLRVEGQLFNWTNVQASQTLAQQTWPLPQVNLRAKRVDLQICAAVIAAGTEGSVLVHYRVSNSSQEAIPAELFVSIRPFQVTPPWQSYRQYGGEFPINQLDWHEQCLRVNDEFVVQALTPVDNCWLQHWLASHPFATKTQASFSSCSIQDDSGLAQGHLRWRLTLMPGQQQDVYLLIPLAGEKCAQLPENPLQTLAAAQLEWQNCFSQFSLRGGAEVEYLQRVMLTATSHILANRREAALQPGPRRYARSWIRDGATMAAALLRMGVHAPVAAFIQWYASYIGADGCVPCCVDQDGADPLPEHDSHGQWLYLLAQYHRFQPDTAFAQQQLVTARRVVRYLQQLRAQRCTEEFNAAEQVAKRGLLPPSVSHEGYLAQPVHSYWDDVWAWRGLLAAAEWFATLNDANMAVVCRTEAQALGEAIQASIARVIAQRTLDFVPGSVEWADFDATATACAVSQLDALALFPSGVLSNTFVRFIDGWQRRVKDGRSLEKYSAYDMRVVTALLHLHQSAPAHALLHFLLQDMRPLSWQQWPEISWPDYRSPGHLGDLPHSWIGAEAVLAIRSLFLLEQGNGLVLGAGIKVDWLDKGVAATAWYTPYGVLDFVMEQVSLTQLRIKLHGNVCPPDGIVVARNLSKKLKTPGALTGDIHQIQNGNWKFSAAPAECIFTFDGVTDNENE